MSRQQLLKQMSAAPETKIQILLSLLGILFSCAHFDGSELSDTLLIILPLLFLIVGRNVSSVATLLYHN